MTRRMPCEPLPKSVLSPPVPGGGRSWSFPVECECAVAVSWRWVAPLNNVDSESVSLLSPTKGASPPAKEAVLVVKRGNSVSANRSVSFTVGGGAMSIAMSGDDLNVKAINLNSCGSSQKPGVLRSRYCFKVAAEGWTQRR